ncbi:MAG: molybdopterin-guanine dinucleotide biosynthesis protein B [Candidatus Loosdrechtia sp.]|uniref:molybdopterin-guanine dinucleotide biosynthesis protein B n=1 Tax=Candidatus Loosdrechtia sp. TaxID=3101272 RepID=UPI003A6DBCE1|nr:MAG: molybdopterin-guanine dinucleotide biosynthesis protein B [Candidatus Jettenia sp. AMX2]
MATNFFISVVGRSGSGKTTLLVRLIKELKSRGYKVATIKHSHHGVDLDTKGKDSWLHTQAGADAVAVVSRTMTGIILCPKEREPLLSEIIGRYFKDMDIIVVEGYKTEAIPKIEVFRTEISTELVCKDDKNLIAVVGDKKPEIDIPFFPVDDNVSRLVDFLFSAFMTHYKAE